MFHHVCESHDGVTQIWQRLSTQKGLTLVFSPRVASLFIHNYLNPVCMVNVFSYLLTVSDSEVIGDVVVLW